MRTFRSDAARVLICEAFPARQAPGGLDPTVALPAPELAAPLPDTQALHHMPTHPVVLNNKGLSLQNSVCTSLKTRLIKEPRVLRSNLLLKALVEAAPHTYPPVARVSKAEGAACQLGAAVTVVAVAVTTAVTIAVAIAVTVAAARTATRRASGGRRGGGGGSGSGLGLGDCAAEHVPVNLRGGGGKRGRAVDA